MNAHEPLLILNEEQISQKVNRLAYQIYEQNFAEEQLVICGIAERGYKLAERVYNKLKEISSFKLELAAVKMNKAEPERTEELKLEPRISGLKDKVVILCDDVLYTGKTLAYATIPFLEEGVKKMQCLVLIQRNYVQFPVMPTYIGMSLATTLQEHVAVNLEGKQGVYLR